MKKINFKIKNVKLAFVILIILAFIVLLLYYHFILTPSFAKSNFTNQMVEISDENENSIFNIQKILLYLKFHRSVKLLILKYKKGGKNGIRKSTAT